MDHCPKGMKNMKMLEIAADIDNLDEVTAFIDEQLEEVGFPMKTIMHIELCVEEIFSNISNYAYENGKGMAKITAEQLSDPERVCIIFSDSGTPFDPLSNPDPDTSNTLKNDKIGGLGIFMVKQQMDGISYSYKNGCNILTIEKLL